MVSGASWRSFHRPRRSLLRRIRDGAVRRVVYRCRGFTQERLQALQCGFDPDFYLQENADVALSGRDPFDHFVRVGRTEGRSAHPERMPPSAEVSPAPAAFVVHAFHVPVFADIVRRLSELPGRHKLFVSTVEAQEKPVRQLLAKYDGPATLQVMPNHGRDVLPFLKALPDISNEGFEIVAKIHTKQSSHRKDGQAWGQDMVQTLLDPDTLRRSLDAFAREPDLGMVGPQGHYVTLRHFMGGNRERVLRSAAGMGLRWDDIRGRGFFAGNMFMARMSALTPLRALAYAEADFEEERGQIDGTLAHVIERCLPLSVVAAGQRVISTGRLRP